MPANPSYLQKFSCFRDLSEEQRKAVAKWATAICFPPGYVLFEEGGPGDHLYLLSKGEVEIFYHIGEANLVKVDLLSGDEVIGCSALVPPFTYTDTASCRTEVEVLDLDAERIRSLMKENCAVGFAIQQQIIRTLLDRITDLRLEVQ